MSGKKICTFCGNSLGKGAAMIIESLGLCYHLSCFKVRATLPLTTEYDISTPRSNLRDQSDSLSFITNLINHSPGLFLQILSSCCWSFLELWSPASSDSPWNLCHLFLYFVFYLSAYSQSQRFYLPSSLLFGLGLFGLALTLWVTFPKLPQCVDCKSDLGGSEAGAEVRIRNKQLYCNFCYMRFKSEYATFMVSIKYLSFFFSKHNITVAFLLAAQPTSMWHECPPANWWRNYMWQQPMNISVNCEAVLVFNVF